MCLLSERRGVPNLEGICRDRVGRTGDDRRLLFDTRSHWFVGSSVETSLPPSSCLVSDTGSPLALLPDSLPVSSALDSCSEISPYPNSPLSGHGLRSREKLFIFGSPGTSGKESVFFFFRSFLLSCLRAYEGLLRFPCEGSGLPLFSENTKESLILTEIENFNPFSSWY